MNNKFKGIFLSIILLIMIFNFNCLIVNADWLYDFDNRLEIIIDSDYIDSNLTHYPYPIFLSSDCGSNSFDGSIIFDELGGSYLKIAITENDESTKLYVEVESWDSINELAVLWVSLSSWIISSSEDTIIYLYYDIDVDNDTSYIGLKQSIPSYNVWDSNFMAVYHLNDGTGVSVDDSTGNYDLDDYDSATSTTTNINGALDFEHSNYDYYRSSLYDLPDTGTNDITLSCWVSFESFINYYGVCGQYEYCVGSYTTARDYGIAGSSTSLVFSAYDDDGDGITYAYSTGSLSTDTWYLMWLTIDLSEKTLYAYNGLNNLGSNYNVNFDADPHFDQETLQISNFYQSLEYDMDGKIDEVRFSLTLRSNSWMKLDYYSQLDLSSSISYEEYVENYVYLTILFSDNGVMNITVINSLLINSSVLNNTVLQVTNNSYVHLFGCPETNMSFSNFTINSVSYTTNPYNLTINGNKTIKCYFENKTGLISIDYTGYVQEDYIVLCFAVICGIIAFAVIVLISDKNKR